MMDRLRAYYADTGVPHDVFDAVYAQRPIQPYDFDRRVRAVTYFQSLPQAESLAAANKRISNILRQAEEKGIAVGETVNAEVLSEAAEQTLADQIHALAKTVLPLFEQRDYEQALGRLAALREAVDTFFDDVMVMVEDTTLRDNRLALLAQLRNLFLQVADLSRLQG
jgi:glycyl-tRNA synthetase beta chain